MRKLSVFISKLLLIMLIGTIWTGIPSTVADSELNGQRVELFINRKLEVYSGPGTHYLRGAKGKAAVSLNDWIIIYGNEDGWTLVEYEIDRKHHRFGYVRNDVFTGRVEIQDLQFEYRETKTASKTTLTDDPDYSENSLAKISKGKQVSVLAYYGEWAYVEYQDVRGFVRRDALVPPEPAIESTVAATEEPAVTLFPVAPAVPTAVPSQMTTAPAADDAARTGLAVKPYDGRHRIAVKWGKVFAITSDHTVTVYAGNGENLGEISSNEGSSIVSISLDAGRLMLIHEDGNVALYSASDYREENLYRSFGIDEPNDSFQNVENFIFHGSFRYSVIYRDGTAKGKADILNLDGQYHYAGQGNIRDIYSNGRVAFLIRKDGTVSTHREDDYELSQEWIGFIGIPDTWSDIVKIVEYGMNNPQPELYLMTENGDVFHSLYDGQNVEMNHIESGCRDIVFCNGTLLGLTGDGSVYAIANHESSRTDMNGYEKKLLFPDVAEICAEADNPFPEEIAALNEDGRIYYWDGKIDISEVTSFPIK